MPLETTHSRTAYTANEPPPRNPHAAAERMVAQLVSDHGRSREELERMHRLLAERLGETK